MFIQCTRNESYSHLKENLNNNFLVLNMGWVSFVTFIQHVTLANMIKIMCQDTINVWYRLITKLFKTNSAEQRIKWVVELRTKCIKRRKRDIFF